MHEKRVVVLRSKFMAKPNYIELGGGKRTERIPILYEDRSVLAIDKPPGWMLVPFSWQKTNWNLQAAIVSSIAAGDFWARSRNLKFLKYVHRLDAETSGVLLFAKSQGAVETFGDLFEERRMEKIYLAVAHGIPKEKEWTCRLKIAQNEEAYGKMRIDPKDGKESETHFTVLQTRSAIGKDFTLIEARPRSGRTHQIRLHLAECGHPISGDPLYGKDKPGLPLGLRAVFLGYADPFTKRPVKIRAPEEEFLREHGFKPRSASPPSESPTPPG
jgi:RluA family pseudouridine synthase